MTVTSTTTKEEGAMTTRAEQLAARFETLNDDIIAAVTESTDEQWRQTSAGEGWSVAALAHHIAEVQGAFAGMVAGLAAGQTYTPNPSMDRIHEGNAQHARDFAAAGKAATLEIQRDSAAKISQLLRGLRDADLDRTAGVFGGNELSVQQVVEYVVIGHAAEHLASLRATLVG